MHTQQVAQLDVFSERISVEALDIALHADHARHWPHTLASFSCLPPLVVFT